LRVYNPSLIISVQDPNGNFTYTWNDENHQTISSDPSTNILKDAAYKVTATLL
jgi:hypothetical protein